MANKLDRTASDDIEFIREVHGRVEDLSENIRADKLSYSNWFLGIATAGFSLTVVQAKDLLADATLPAPELFLLAGSSFCLISACIGALVKYSSRKERQYSRPVLKYREHEYLRLYKGTKQVALPVNVVELTSRVEAGTYLLPEEKERFNQATRKRARAAAWCEKLLVLQQLLVIVAYVAILLLFASGVMPDGS